MKKIINIQGKLFCNGNYIDVGFKQVIKPIKKVKAALC